MQLNAQNSSVVDSIAKKLKIKEVIKRIYFGENEALSMTYTELYDTNGKLTKRISYNNNFNSIVIKEYYFYNQQGQLEKDINIKYNLSDSSVYTQTYSYNSKGDLDSNAFGKIRYKFDEKGRLIESIEKTVTPVDLKIIYSYDSQSRLKEEKQYFINGLRARINWKYNKIGQIVKKISTYYDSNNDQLTSAYINTFVYNKIGLLTTEYQKQIKISIINKKEVDRIYRYEYSFY